MLSSNRMTTDPFLELKDHLLEVKEDRDALLKERDLQSQLLRRVASWIQEHAQHPPECARNKGGQCSCGLETLRKDLL
jgi:hypothetical protein